MRILAVLTAALMLTAALAAAQTTPRGVAKQARADRKMERAHTIRHDESLSREPKLVRKEEKLDHHKAAKQRL